MTLARILLKLWNLRRWVAVGIVLGILAAVGSVATSSSTVYANASTQMLVDSPTSALANAGADITGYIARANVFARLMTTDEALQYIGQAAGIPGNLIDANGPVEINGSPVASHAPIVIRNGSDLPGPTTYKLSFVQNPDLPTVDVYAQAPTTAKAIALANGAVSGFAALIAHLNANNVPIARRIEVRSLGQATGGIVDPGASKKIAVFIFFAVLALWCGAVLFVNRLLADLRFAKNDGAGDLFSSLEDEMMQSGSERMGSLPSLDDHAAPSAADRSQQVGTGADARDEGPDADLVGTRPSYSTQNGSSAKTQRMWTTDEGEHNRFVPRH